MRSLAYPTALGCCVLCTAYQASGAEWSAQPSISLATFEDSNPRLTAAQDSAFGTSVSADLQLKRAMETSSLLLEPRFLTRRYDDSQLGDVNDRPVLTQFDHTGERSQLSLSGQYEFQSTLLSELQQTGVTRDDTNQRSIVASSNYSWMNTERRLLVTQFSYSDISYVGPGHVELPGYRYFGGQVGERFVLSERTHLMLSAVGNRLVSDRPGGSSHELGVQLELYRALSERTVLDAWIGESRRFLYGTNSNGTNASVSLSRSMPRGSFGLNYLRSLVPYGSGFSVERQQYGATSSYQITQYLNANLALLRVVNNETAELLGIDRRSYDSVDFNLVWLATQHWTIRGNVTALRTTAIRSSEDVKEWRGGMSLQWTPAASVISR